ncbi:MAG: peptide chain release factor N(5)-glutamine methyltransferase [Muribaculaceae bacterium]|nr:peptide chain release factor N(5)-glutamine methyltransferase [Muribaculaceae bacterium]
MTVREQRLKLRESLVPIYGYGEARAIIRIIFHSLKGWDATDLIIHEGDQLSDYITEKIEEIVKRLMNHEPIQYILGKTYFYGMDLDVDRSTLIPRPETEELVDMIVKGYRDKKDLRVLDIGTGSGAIAIALARNLPFSDVTAIDISNDALSVAQRNAENFKTGIKFLNEDIFYFSPHPDSFDIIVSNPPYIDESEKKDMEKNVLDYEPHSALFVPDENPIIFYSRIIEIARESLSSEGSLWFEINPRHCEEITRLLDHEGFIDIEARKDINGKNRFISAKRK